MQAVDFYVWAGTKKSEIHLKQSLFKTKKKQRKNKLRAKGAGT